jgi:predicted ArsR family transcriptional regulator
MPSRPRRWRLARLTRARAAVLQRLADQPEPCRTGALAAMMHQHPNTIREHLDALVADGLATRQAAEPSGRGRPAWLYAAVPLDAEADGSGGVAREYAGLAAALASHLARSSEHPQEDAVEAGTEWGRRLVQDSSRSAAPNATAARREVVRLLDELGFAPVTDARAAVVRLRRCPLLEAAHQYPAVVCGVHLGLVRGALEELGGQPDGTELRPFSEPGACRLDLLPRRAG